MIGLDTNVLVRFLVRKNEAQARRDDACMARLISEEGHDFADLVIREVALSRGAHCLVTFGRRLSRLAGVELA